MISLYDSMETDFTHNGLVVLSDCISFYTTEKNNESYEVEFVYPLDERGKWLFIVEGNIVKNSKGQLFRIYRKVKTLEGIKANARHIFYDLSSNFLEDVRPTNQTGAGALDWILDHTQYAHPFTNVSDVGGTVTRYFQKTNPVEAILGQDGIIANAGGEIERDNFTIKLLQARGLDRGVLVSYGKNIIGIEETIGMDNVITRIYPTGKDGITIAEGYVDSPLINSYPHPIVREVQFSEIDNETALRVAAQNYFAVSKCDIPIATYVVDFLELSKTEEYKNYAVLERIYLCDTTTIRHSRLNMDLKCKAISIKFNDLTDRIEKVELGSFKPNIVTGISNAIQGVQQEILNIKSAYQKAIDNATALITGSSGGNVVIRQDETGKPYEILIMDTADVMTAEQVWRWNLGGFGHSSTGVEGPFDTAITQDGSIVASFITGLLGEFAILRADQIEGGTLTMGGANNVDGLISVLSALGVEVVKIDKDGIVVTKGNISGVTITGSIIEALDTVTIQSGSGTGIITTGLFFGNIASGYGAKSSIQGYQYTNGETTLKIKATTYVQIIAENRIDLMKANGAGCLVTTGNIAVASGSHVYTDSIQGCVTSDAAKVLIGEGGSGFENTADGTMRLKCGSGAYLTMSGNSLGFYDAGGTYHPIF